MKEFVELYCNYGCLSAEKRALYSYGAPIDSATTSEKITVSFPDRFWSDGWTIEENEMGEQLLCSPWKRNYTWDMVLEGNQTPCVHAVDEDGHDRRYMLKKM